VRRWSAAPLTDQQLKRVVEAAAWAPSAGNRQPWAFVVVREAGRIKRLRAAIPGMSSVPAAIVAVCLNRRHADPEPGTAQNDMVLLTLGGAMQNLLLAAHGEHIGACALGSYHPPSIRSILGLPEYLDPKVLVALGHPAEQASAPSRRPLVEMCFFEEVRAR
jgi:nitroreductase